MWTWLLMAHLVMLVAAIGRAYVALFTKERRADHVYQIFKIAINAITGGTDIVAAVLYLHGLDSLGDLIGLLGTALSLIPWRGSSPPAASLAGADTGHVGVPRLRHRQRGTPT